MNTQEYYEEYEDISLGMSYLEQTNRKKKPISKLHDINIDKRSYLPILKEVKAINGKLHSTTLDVWLVTDTELEDGMYKIIGKDILNSKTDGSDFPILPEVEPITTIKGYFLSDLKRSLKAIDKKAKITDMPSAPLINFIIEDGIVIVQATEGHKLTQNTIPITQTGEDGSYVLPYKAIELLTKDPATMEIQIEFGEKWSLIKNGNIEVTAQNSEHRFPKCSEVIPDYIDRCYIVNKKRLMKTLNSFRPYKPDSDKVELCKGDCFYLEVNNTTEEIGKTVDINIIETEGIKNLNTDNISMLMKLRPKDEPSNHIASYNYKFLKQLIQEINSDEIYLGMIDNINRPVLLYGTEYEKRRLKEK